MCLAVPGKVTEIIENPVGMTMGKVSFGGIVKDVCLAWLPEVQVGDYVLVHVGFALSRVDEKEAEETFKLLEQMGELADLADADPAPAADATVSGTNSSSGPDAVAPRAEPLSARGSGPSRAGSDVSGAGRETRKGVPPTAPDEPGPGKAPGTGSGGLKD